MTGYLVKESLGPIAAAILLFLGLLASVDLVAGMARMVLASQGLAAATQYLCLSLAGWLLLTVPMGLFLGLMGSYRRLANDNEILAMQGGGLSPFFLARPGLALGLGLGLVTLLAGEGLVPKTSRELVNLVSRSEGIARSVVSGPMVLKDGHERLICLRDFRLQEKRARGVFIHDFWEGRRVRQYYCDEAVWQEGQWSFRGLRTMRFGSEEELEWKSTLQSVSTNLGLGQSLLEPERLIEAEVPIETLSRSQILRRLAELPAQALGERRKLAFAYHHRVTLALACPLLAGLAAVFGLRPGKTGPAFPLAVSCCVFFLYWLILTAARTLCEAGQLDPLVAAELPNLAVVVALLVTKGLRPLKFQIPKRDQKRRSDIPPGLGAAQVRLNKSQNR